MEQLNRKGFILNYVFYSPLIIKELHTSLPNDRNKMKRIYASRPFWILRDGLNKNNFGVVICLCFSLCCASVLIAVIKNIYMLNKYLTNRQLVSIFIIEMQSLLHTLNFLPKGRYAVTNQRGRKQERTEACPGEEQQVITNVIQNDMVLRKSKQIFSWFYYCFSVLCRQYNFFQATLGADHTPAPPHLALPLVFRSIDKTCILSPPKRDTLYKTLYK